MNPLVGLAAMGLVGACSQGLTTASATDAGFRSPDAGDSPDAGEAGDAAPFYGCLDDNPACPNYAGSGSGSGSGTSNTGSSTGGLTSSGSSSSGCANGSSSSSGGSGSGSSGGDFDASALCAPMSLAAVPAVSVTTVGTSLGGMSGPGGPIPGGTYYLTSEIVYAGGANDPATREVWVFDACAGTARETDDSSPAAAWTYALVDDSTYGWVINLTPLCGGTAIKLPYTGRTTDFIVYDFVHSRVETFTKQ